MQCAMCKCSYPGTFDGAYYGSIAVVFISQDPPDPPGQLQQGFGGGRRLGCGVALARGTAGC